MNKYALIFLTGVFISAWAQVLLKKSALKKYPVFWRNYVNGYVASAYGIFVLSTFMSLMAYRGLPLKAGAVLGASSYLFVAFFSRVSFGERLSPGKVAGLMMLLAGTWVFFGWK